VFQILEQFHHAVILSGNVYPALGASQMKKESEEEMGADFGFVEPSFWRNGIWDPSSKHGITNDKYSMANSQFPAGSNTSWVLRIENWPLKIGYWLSRLPLDKSEKRPADGARLPRRVAGCLVHQGFPVPIPFARVGARQNASSQRFFMGRIGHR
jgi:hypothetical protein